MKPERPISREEVLEAHRSLAEYRESLKREHPADYRQMTEAAQMRDLATEAYGAPRRMEGMVGHYMTEQVASNHASLIIADSGLWSAYGGDCQMVGNGSGIASLRAFLPQATPNMIDLQIHNGLIVAIHTGPHAALIVELFGTPIVPTAFTAEFGLDRAAEEIQRTSPDCIVYPKRRDQ